MPRLGPGSSDQGRYRRPGNWLVTWLDMFGDGVLDWWVCVRNFADQGMVALGNSFWEDCEEGGMGDGAMAREKGKMATLRFDRLLRD